MNHILNKTPKYIKNSCDNCKKSDVYCISLNNPSYHISLQCKHHICLECYELLYEKTNCICHFCIIKENQAIFIYLNIATAILLIQYPTYIWYVLYLYLIWIIKVWLNLFYY